MSLDISKVYIVDFKDVRGPQKDSSLFAEIVLIDRSHPAIQPLLYQLNNEASSMNDLSSFKSHIISLSRDSLQEIGPIASIDKRNKQILLANQNTVHYKYMIIASGANHSFVGGLQTLVDALKMKSLPAFDHFEKEGVFLQKLKTPAISLGTESGHDIDKLANRKILEGLVKAQSCDLSPNCKLYEIQL